MKFNLFQNLLHRHIRFVSCCWAALRMDSVWSSTKDCATSNAFSSTVSSTVAFLELYDFSRSQFLRSALSFVRQSILRQGFHYGMYRWKVALFHCKIFVDHPRIIKRDIRSFSERYAIITKAKVAKYKKQKMVWWTKKSKN